MLPGADIMHYANRIENIVQYALKGLSFSWVLLGSTDLMKTDNTSELFLDLLQQSIHYRYVVS